MQIRWMISVAGLGLALTTGCSGDFGLEGADDGGVTAGTGGASEDEGVTSGAADETGTGEAGPADDDSADGTGAEDTGQAPPTEGECDLDIDCGAGLCELDEDGAPQCVCDEGFAAYGLRCLPCTPTSGDVEIDIPHVAVTASFLLNGEAFPGGVYEQGAIDLRDPNTGDTVRLGVTTEGGTDGAVAVLPGNYEVHYTRLAGGTQVPANSQARIETVEIPDTDGFDLEIDVPAVQLSGVFTMNGDDPPEGEYENGSVVLRNRATGDEVELGQTNQGDYQLVVVPGIYDVHYRRRLAETEAPLNRNALVETVEVYDAPNQVLDLDIPVTLLSGTFTLDGMAPPPGAYENGRILLRDTVTGDETPIGQTMAGSYSVPMVPGNYEVVYERLLGGDEVPVNRGAVLQSAEFAAIEHELNIDIETAVVTGTITVGGAPPPADPGDDGLIVLRNVQTGDEAVLGNTANGVYSRRVVRGTYDVYYRQETSSGGVPVNTNARLQGIDVMGGAAFDIDVPMVTVSASVTVDGMLPPDSAYDDGLLYLRDASTGDSVLLGNTREATLQRPVVPSTYDLVYVVEAAGPTMPINAEAHLDTVDVNVETDLSVDIPVLDLHGLVTVGGESPPGGAYDQAILLLHDVLTKDVVYLGPIASGEFRQSLTAGTYVLAYRALTTTGLLPANDNAGLACLELTP